MAPPRVGAVIIYRRRGPLACRHRARLRAPAGAPGRAAGRRDLTPPIIGATISYTSGRLHLEACVSSKRLMVLGLSAVIGVVLAFAVVLFIRLSQSNVTIEYYGYDYFILTALFLGAAVLVWLDYFMKTGILPK
jgi:hypothetical protein